MLILSERLMENFFTINNLTFMELLLMLGLSLLLTTILLTIEED